MRRLLPFTSLLLLCTLAQPATASLIPIDPVIGVRGITGGSEPSTSSAFFEMEGCDLDFDDPTFCLEYDILQSIDGITSLTLQFRDASGLIPNDVIVLDESSLNGFNVLTRLDDGFSVRLSFDGEGVLLCPVIGENEFPILVPCAQGSTIQVYLFVPPHETPNPPYSASLRAINDVAVPEPGLLILMGMGLVLVGRRLRRRRVPTGA